MDMLRLCRNDNFGMRWLVPSLLLRLGKEQECYDFSLWWVTIGKDGSYDWEDTSLPHLSIKDADIFEAVDVFCGKDTIFFTFDMLLLKIKLLLDLKTLQRSPNNIDEIATTIVQSRKEELRTIGLQSLIDRVESQVQQLYSSLKKSNANLWPVFLDPKPHLAASPEYLSSGSLEEAQIALQNSYQVWDDTQGAVDMVRSLVAQDPDFLSIR
ncbi:hypothetical protein IWX49DRAFT_171844 [Phyllosticta citricarpa]|uniref:Uncharacterized protein n=1 Tax=Phyllosticta paracitricarpa TaxID=2016321 RepID=A0ABR1N6Y3_9PEZI